MLSSPRLRSDLPAAPPSSPASSLTISQMTPLPSPQGAAPHAPSSPRVRQWPGAGAGAGGESLGQGAPDSHCHEPDRGGEGKEPDSGRDLDL